MRINRTFSLLMCTGLFFLGVINKQGILIILALSFAAMAMILTSPFAYTRSDNYQNVLEDISYQGDAIPQKIKDLVLARQQGICGAKDCTHTHYLECHHIISRRLGGTNHPSNLVYLCPNCHASADKGQLIIKQTYTY